MLNTYITTRLLAQPNNPLAHLVIQLLIFLTTHLSNSLPFHSVAYPLTQPCICLLNHTNIQLPTNLSTHTLPHPHAHSLALNIFKYPNLNTEYILYFKLCWVSQCGFNSMHTMLVCHSISPKNISSDQSTINLWEKYKWYLKPCLFMVLLLCSNIYVWVLFLFLISILTLFFSSKKKNYKSFIKH